MPGRFGDGIKFQEKRPEPYIALPEYRAPRRRNGVTQDTREPHFDGSPTGPQFIFKVIFKTRRRLVHPSRERGFPHRPGPGIPGTSAPRGTFHILTLVGLPPGKVVHITLKKFPLGGSGNDKTHITGITGGPDPNDLYIKLEMPNPRGGLRHHLQNILAVKVYIGQGCTFHTTAQDRQIFKKILFSYLAVEFYPGKGPVPDM
jgi:hypothetical protein